MAAHSGLENSLSQKVNRIATYLLVRRDPLVRRDQFAQISGEAIDIRPQ